MHDERVPGVLLLPHLREVHRSVEERAYKGQEDCEGNGKLCSRAIHRQCPQVDTTIMGERQEGKNNLFLAVRADLPVARSAPGITIQNDSADFQRGLIFQGPQCRGFLITDGAVKCAVDGRKQPVHAVASFSSIQCPGSGDHKAPYNNDREYAVDELPEAVRCPS